MLLLIKRSNTKELLLNSVIRLGLNMKLHNQNSVSCGNNKYHEDFTDRHTSMLNYI